MLHKSFKPAKCKTALKLASSRLKLLKNKKEVQVKQMKRELAQLLESCQDQTARIRVEHVVREEKMMAAYELVEIYCELIVARLSIIESQKNCPIDLKEAVSSVVFASPRCSDVPELMDIRKHFTAKYGKDFISAAVELRPDCGVSRTLVEKLSAKAPDGPTKVKILTSIAEEHNIKWDPESFGDKDSRIHEDLLNGPSTFEKASKLQPQASNFQVPHNDRERTNVHVAAQNVVNDDASVNLHENNSGSSFGHQIIPPGHDNSRSSFGHQNIPPGHANVPATSHPEPKTPGNAMEGAEAGHAYPSEENVDCMGRQNWNMEFKDATSAAQAAAESAERASMAARAAAQLSSRGRISMQYSTEPQRSPAHGSMDEWAGRAAGSSFQNEAYAKVAGDRAFNGRNAQPHTPNKQNYAHEEYIGEVGERFPEDGHMSNNRPSQYASMRSHMEPMDNNSFEKSSSYGINNERSERYMNPKSEGGFSGRVPVNDTFEARIPGMHRGQPDVRDNDRLAGVNERPYRESNKRSSESSRSNSRKSSADFSGVDSLVNGREMAGRITQNSLSGAEPGNVLDKSSVMGNSFRPETSGILDELSERRNSGGSEVESANDLQDDFIYAKHSTHASYHSHSSQSSTFGDNREVMSDLKEKDDVAENPFADFDEENFQKDNKSAIESTAVVFDDYGSDDDDYGFDLDKGAEPSAKTSQPSWESPSYPSASIGLPSPKRTTMEAFPKTTPQSSFSMNQDDPIFSRGLADSSVHSQADELEPVTFDESNGPSSESEDERSNYKEEREYSSLGSQKKFGFGDLHSSLGKSSFNSKNKGLDTSDDPVDKKHQSQPFNAYEDAFIHEVEESASVFSEPSTIDDSKSPHEDSYDSGLGLAFGRLTGGLKNKGNRHPSYLSSAGDASLSKQTAEHTAKETSSSFPLNISADSVVQQDPESEEVGSEFKKRPTRGPAFTSFGSVSDQIPEKTVPQENSRSRRQRQVQKMEQEADDAFTRRASTRPVIPSLGPYGVYASERTSQGQISDSHPEPYSQQQSEVDERSKSSGGSSASFELREEERGLRTRRERYIEKMQPEVDDNLTRRASTRPVIPSLGSDGIYASEGTLKEQINDSGFEPYTKEESEANKRSGSTGSSTNSRERIGPGLSRRTKAGAPSTHRSTNLKSTFASDESEEHSADSRSSLRSSYPTETSTRPHSAADEAYSLRGSEHSRYGKEAKGEPISGTRSSSRGESLKSIAKEQPSSSISKKTSTTKSGMSEDSLKSIAREQPSLPIQKKVSSAKSETSESSKAATPSLGSASREDSFKRASHVHPKLPDYDTFAATLQSLRANRK